MYEICSKSVNVCIKSCQIVNSNGVEFYWGQTWEVQTLWILRSALLARCLLNDVYQAPVFDFRSVRAETKKRGQMKAPGITTAFSTNTLPINPFVWGWSCTPACSSAHLQMTTSSPSWWPWTFLPAICKHHHVFAGSKNATHKKSTARHWATATTLRNAVLLGPI